MHGDQAFQGPVVASSGVLFRGIPLMPLHDFFPCRVSELRTSIIFFLHFNLPFVINISAAGPKEPSLGSGTDISTIIQRLVSHQLHIGQNLEVLQKMLPKVLLVCLLDLIAARTAFGWNHVSRDKLESIISKNDVALVACKSPIDGKPAL